MKEVGEGRVGGEVLQLCGEQKLAVSRRLNEDLLEWKGEIDDVMKRLG